MCYSMVEIPDVKKAIDKGDKIKFSARINDDGAGAAVWN